MCCFEEQIPGEERQLHHIASREVLNHFYMFSVFTASLTRPWCFSLMKLKSSTVKFVSLQEEESVFWWTMKVTRRWHAMGVNLLCRPWSELWPQRGHLFLLLSLFIFSCLCFYHLTFCFWVTLQSLLFKFSTFSVPLSYTFKWTLLLSFSFSLNSRVSVCYLLVAAVAEKRKAFLVSGHQWESFSPRIFFFLFLLCSFLRQPWLAALLPVSAFTALLAFFGIRCVESQSPWSCVSISVFSQQLGSVNCFASSSVFCSSNQPLAERARRTNVYISQSMLEC